MEREETSGSLGLRVGFPCGSVVKNLPASAGDVSSIPTSGRFPGRGNGNALQYSCLETPWTEEPGGLQSMGLQRVRHDEGLNTTNSNKDRGMGQLESDG